MEDHIPTGDLVAEIQGVAVKVLNRGAGEDFDTKVSRVVKYQAAVDYEGGEK